MDTLIAGIEQNSIVAAHDSQANAISAPTTWAVAVSDFEDIDLSFSHGHEEDDNRWIKV